jgi:hypothetical protein
MLLQLDLSRSTCIALAVCVALAEGAVLWTIVPGFETESRPIVIFFFARPLLCALLAFPIARFSRLPTTHFMALFAVPQMIELHGFYIWVSHGELELWGLFFGLDVAMFFPSVLLYGLGARGRIR